MVKYVLQKYDVLYEEWEDTHSSWSPGCYSEKNLMKMIKSNLDYAKKVQPWAKFRVVKRETVDEVIF